MASPKFYNENRNRSFPFLKRSVGVRTPAQGLVTMRQLPPDWIVDAGFTMGCESEYDDVAHQVFLRRIWREGSTIGFAFGSDAPRLWGHDLVFYRDVASNEYELEFSDGDLPEDSHAVWLLECEQPLWTGYLVTWNMSELATRLPDGQEIIRETGDAIVEPALIHNLSRGLLGSIALANDDRTRITAPEGCDEPVWPYPTGIIFQSARCLQGEIRWKPGYNCTITQDPSENSITLAAKKGAGEGEPCDEVPLFDSEQAPLSATNDLLSGGPRCNETLRSINGVGGPMLTISAGLGVAIVPDPENHKLTVAVDLRDLVTCFQDLSIVSEHV